MKRFVYLTLILLLSSCAKPSWHQTTDGRFVYGIFNDKYNLVWNGPSNIAFVDGKGSLSLIDDEGRLKEKFDISTKMGAVTDFSYVHTDVGEYLGEKKKGLPHGFGVLINDGSITIGNFKKGRLSSGRFAKYQLRGQEVLPVLIGTAKKGKASGVAKEYKDGVLIYEGSFKRGLRHGVGQEFDGDMLIYSGEWKKGKRNGDGTQYKENGLIVYKGEWEDGEYDGYGKLYENGVCQEGRWDSGRLTRSISTSVISEITRATKLWFSSDSLAVQKDEILQENLSVASSQLEFIEGLNNDLEDYLHSKIDKRVEKRFGFWNLLRMIFQPWFSSDVKRASSAQEYFCKDVQTNEVQNWINEKVDFYNRNSADKLSYINLSELSDDSIVNTDVALKIFDREALETTDVGVGILVDIIVCIVIAVIIGIIIGAFIPSILPYAGIFDAILAIIAFGIGLYLSVFRTNAISLELEASIKQLLVDNYMLFLDSQNIISQLLGL